MNKYLHILSGLILLMLTAIPAYAASVQGVRLGLHTGTTRLVVDLDGIKDYRVFVMQNPYRMAIDLPSYDWRVGKVPKPPGSGVTAVRQGPLNKDVSRIVIDLDRPVAIKSAFLLPGASGKAGRLVIDFNATNQAGFDAAKTKIFGTMRKEAEALSRQPDATPPQPKPIAKAVRSAAAAPPREPDNEDRSAPAPPPAASGDRPLIVIDPGHGGIDPGALGANGVFEKNVSLGMARELKRQLEGTGRYRVLLTRDGDTYLKLHERVEFARRNHASMFVSLHADSISRAGVEGASIYTLSDKASDEQTEKLAARENRADLIGGLDVKDPDEQVATILVDLVVRDNGNQSRFFANKVVDSMGQKGIRLLENTHRFAGFAVLKAPDIPSVLIELGFMTSAAESAKLSSEPYRQKVSNAIVAGIDSYFSQVGGRSRN